MLLRAIRWYRKWEDEVLAVLKQPELAADAPGGYRRDMAERLATLSPLERRELYDFSTQYRGRKGVLLIVKMMLAFSLGGVFLKLVLKPQLDWLAALVAANLLGLFMAFMLVGVWFNYRRVAQAKMKMFLAVVGLGFAGGLAGMAISTFVRGKSVEAALEHLPHDVALILVIPAVLFALPSLAIAVIRNRRYETLTAQLQEQAERERLARELSESQLRLLRAQIEPHFLFNTLGAVQQLAEQGAPRAAALTADLIDFLRASLSDMRTEQVSLQAEFRLVESYLRVMEARLGGRLRYELSLPDALAHVQLPSMIVLTLAENAIKHGIEPALRGGTIRVTAEDAGSAIRIRVRDSGVGMSVTPGHGLGLDNIRHRLRLAFGDAAGLALYDADPGFEADITIPKPEAA
ncbi:sensor histidine kinase [Massilia sp. ST3]|uniref:sensor histidine kinase n=1 Tax=Massilia sp. ST3 TaxID=2824903 RepID=UPI001B83C626|nr:histidine kinase [Massilia sp. ST3]MBQ5949342.1 histidine kinase [Massilia sp. ST3]